MMRTVTESPSRADGAADGSAAPAAAPATTDSRTSRPTHPSSPACSAHRSSSKLAPTSLSTVGRSTRSDRSLHLADVAAPMTTYPSSYAIVPAAPAFFVSCKSFFFLSLNISSGGGRGRASLWGSPPDPPRGWHHPLMVWVERWRFGVEEASARRARSRAGASPKSGSYSRHSGRGGRGAVPPRAPADAVEDPRRHARTRSRGVGMNGGCLRRRSVAGDRRGGAARSRPQPLERSSVCPGENSTGRRAGGAGSAPGGGVVSLRPAVDGGVLSDSRSDRLSILASSSTERGE